MLCVVIRGPSYEEAYKQLKEAHLADAVEFRLDQLNTLSLATIKDLMRLTKLPVIFTVRDEKFQGTEEYRWEVLKKLAALQPKYLDVECNVPDHVCEEITHKYPKVQIIRSYHNFKETPGNLQQIYQQMEHPTASLYKLATYTSSTLEAMEMLLLAKEAKKPTAAMGMGLAGEVTRILGPILGSPITYTALSQEDATATGQMTLKELKELYHFDQLNPDTEIYGLIGSSLRESKGALFHNNYFAFEKRNSVYVKFPLEPHEVESFLEMAHQIPIRGLSVTTPLKEVVMEYVDEIDETAQAMGAVNTLLLKEGKIYGTNTDGLGALNAIEHTTPVHGKKVVVLGAGGAAKAIAYEAKRRGAEVTVLNRNVERAQKLGYACGSLEEIEGIDYDILVNATTSYMPIEPDSIRPHTTVMDVHNSVSDLPLLQEAKQRGCKTVWGFHMFVEQALAQYAFWFNL